MSKKHQPNKFVGVKAAMYYSGLPTNRQKEKMVTDAETKIYQSYHYLLTRKPAKKLPYLRDIASRVAFLYWVKGDDYCKIAMYRVMVRLHTDGLVWIAWKASGHPMPKTAYFFVKRTIRLRVPFVGSQVSFWEGEAILSSRRGYN